MKRALLLGGLIFAVGAVAGPAGAEPRPRTTFTELRGERPQAAPDRAQAPRAARDELRPQPIPLAPRLTPPPPVRRNNNPVPGDPRHPEPPPPERRNTR